MTGKSIRVRLLKWLIAPILLTNLAGASLTWLLAWRPAAESSGDMVRAVLLLEAIFTLVLAGLIWFSVTTGLRPLARLRTRLLARAGAADGDLAPLEAASVPYELAPVVGAFNELLEKVQTSTRAQHDFLADVAHQLRTPLAGMHLQLEHLARRHHDDPDTVHALGLMLQSNERMIRQTNQLLALARAEPSRFEKTRLEPLDLASLVESSIQAWVEQAATRRIDLGFDLQPAWVMADGFLLRDLIDNLVDNALRYTPPDGTVTVRTGARDGAGLLEVEDSGPGIAPALRARVFQRHVRLDDKSAGNGLGLAIVREVAAAHGASITLDEGAGGAGLLVALRFP